MECLLQNRAQQDRIFKALDKKNGYNFCNKKIMLPRKLPFKYCKLISFHNDNNEIYEIFSNLRQQVSYRNPGNNVL